MTPFQRNIQHVVVLMLENRSFDHMLGFVGIGNGLTGTEFNFLNPAAQSGKFTVTRDASYTGDFDLADPSHSLQDVLVQLGAGLPGHSANDGFVSNYRQQGKDAQNHTTDATAGNVMKCFDPKMLPALTTLAREFVVCDNWFCSLPAQTWPNRFFAHAATSMGQIDNQPRVYPARTIYDNLTLAGEDWAVYFHDIPQCLMLSSLRRAKYTKNFLVFSERFKRDCDTGVLPSYSFIEPRYFNFLALRANDQHPPHDVALGDQLIADVYEAIRNSPMWDSTLLFVLWDEHGGIFDHVSPPAAPNPDSLTHQNPDFDFARLGPRVPAVIVSPWVRKGNVDSTSYDHTSVLASVKVLFGLQDFLTERDRAAATVEHLVGDQKRDAGNDPPPTALPRAGAQIAAPTSAALAPAAIAQMMDQRSDEPLSELQQSLVDLAKQIQPPDLDRRVEAARLATAPMDEHSAAVTVRQATQQFLRR
jgi:phospholipase C